MVLIERLHFLNRIRKSHAEREERERASNESASQFSIDWKICPVALPLTAPLYAHVSLVQSTAIISENIDTNYLFGHCQAILNESDDEKSFLE